MSGRPRGRPPGSSSHKSVEYIVDSSPEKQPSNKHSRSPSRSRRSISPLSDTELPANPLDWVSSPASKEARVQAKSAGLNSASQGNNLHAIFCALRAYMCRSCQCNPQFDSEEQKTQVQGQE